MKLIVGLGNPGRQYEATRHNLGYAVLAELARRHATGRPQEKFHAEVVEADLNGQRALLVGPVTYMNLSGASVVEAVGYYKVTTENLLIICDDFHLPLGKLRIRAKGSSGGHKGLEDIIRRLGTEEIPRLRIGIGPPPEGWDPSRYVLARFTEEERPIIEQAVVRAADAVGVWACQGIQACMNQFH